MFQKILKIAVPWIGSVLLMVWGLFKLLLDWVGRSTSADDAEQLMMEKLPAWTEWLLSTPWWVPSLCAVVLTGWLIWLSRHPIGYGQSGDDKVLDFRNAPAVTQLRLQFYDGNQVPKKIEQTNVYHWYVKGNFIYHPLDAEKKYLGMWRITVFIIFDKEMPAGTFDIDCQNCELPPYHVEQFSMRHAIISFNNILNKATLTITINKSDGKPYRI